MKNMKKFASLGLSLVMMLSLAAWRRLQDPCGLWLCCTRWFRRRLRCRR